MLLLSVVLTDNKTHFTMFLKEKRKGKEKKKGNKFRDKEKVDAQDRGPKSRIEIALNGANHRKSLVRIRALQARLNTK